MIEVNPDTEAKLKALAESNGVTVDALLQLLVSDASDQVFRPQTGIKAGNDKLAEFQAWVDQFSTVGAGLSYLTGIPSA